MMGNSYNDVVFDALLKRAVAENFEHELSELSDAELANKYVFSERHEARMQRLFRRERVKCYLYSAVKVSKRIAAVIVISTVVIFGVLLFNADVRAEVQKVIVEWYEKFTSFTFTGSEQTNTSEWRPSYIPDGFEEIEISQYGVFTDILYADDSGLEIRFTFSPAKEGLNISVDNENRQLSTITINGEEAFLLTAKFPNIENGLIWQKDGYTFDIWSLLDTDELLKISESVEIKK